MKTSVLLDLYELTFDFGEEVLIEKEAWCARHLGDRKLSSTVRGWDRLKSELRKIDIGVQFPAYEIIHPGQEGGACRGIGIILPRGTRELAEESLNALHEEPKAKPPRIKVKASMTDNARRMRQEKAREQSKQNREALTNAAVLVGPFGTAEDLCELAEVEPTQIHLLIAEDLLTVMSVPRTKSAEPWIPWRRTGSGS